MDMTEASAASSRKECGCLRQEQDPCHATPQEDATNLASLGQSLHTSFHSHKLTRLFLNDLEIKLSEEVQRREATEKDITCIRNVHSANILYNSTEDVTLKSSKRCHCREEDLQGVGDREKVSTAKRMRTEEVVLSL